MPTLVVIDHDIEFCRLLVSFFSSRGYGVRYAMTAHDGAALASRLVPDITILDLEIEDMDGVELVRIMKERCQRCMVIGLTSSARYEDRLKALSSGIDFFAIKPVSLDMLLQVMEAR